MNISQLFHELNFDLCMKEVKIALMKKIIYHSAHITTLDTHRLHLLLSATLVYSLLFTERDVLTLQRCRFMRKDL